MLLPYVGQSVHQLVDDGFLFLTGEFKELRIKEQEFGVGSPKHFKQSLNTRLLRSQRLIELFHRR